MQPIALFANVRFISGIHFFLGETCFILSFSYPTSVRLCFELSCDFFGIFLPPHGFSRRGFGFFLTGNFCLLYSEFSPFLPPGRRADYFLQECVFPDIFFLTAQSVNVGRSPEFTAVPRCFLQLSWPNLPPFFFFFLPLPRKQTSRPPFFFFFKFLNFLTNFLFEPKTQHWDSSRASICICAGLYGWDEPLLSPPLLLFFFFPIATAAQSPAQIKRHS